MKPLGYKNMKTYKADISFIGEVKKLKEAGVTLGEWDDNLGVFKECSFDAKTKEKLGFMSVVLLNIMEFEETNIREEGDFS